MEHATSSPGGGRSAAPAGDPPLLAMRGIVKRYAGVQALRGVDFEVVAGEVHALVGENGAGKSTLIKIVSGVEQADAGEVLLDGRGCASTPRRPRSRPASARSSRSRTSSPT